MAVVRKDGGNSRSDLFIRILKLSGAVLAIGLTLWLVSLLLEAMEGSEEAADFRSGIWIIGVLIFFLLFAAYLVFRPAPDPSSQNSERPDTSGDQPLKRIALASLLVTPLIAFFIHPLIGKLSHSFVLLWMIAVTIATFLYRMRLGGRRADWRKLLTPDAPNLAQQIQSIIRLHPPLDQTCAWTAAIATHFARVDGRITADEQHTLKQALEREFPSVNHVLMARVIATTADVLRRQSAAENRASLLNFVSAFEAAAPALAAPGPGTMRQMREFVAETIINVILADGRATAEEKLLFEELARALRLSPAAAESIWRMVEGKRGRRSADGASQAGTTGDALQLLGL